MRDQRPWASSASSAALLVVLGGAACVAVRPKAEGARCHEAIDCEQGLACVPTAAGGAERLCSRNLDGLGRPAAPADADDAGADATAGTVDGGSDALPGDAGDAVDAASPGDDEDAQG